MRLAGRDPVVDVGHLDRLDAPIAQLADVLAHRDAPGRGPGLLLHDEGGDPLFGAGGEGDDPARSPLVTQALVPLITYSSPSPRRLAGDVAGIASGVGLRQRQRPAPVAGRHGGKPTLLLLLGAVRHDQCGRHGVGVDDPGQAHPAVGQFLDDADVGQQVESEAAVGLGDGHAEEAELAHLGDDVGRIGVVVLELGRHRDDLVGHEAADGFDDLAADLGVGGRRGGGG